MWAAPIGAFGAIAFTVGRFGAGSLVSLGKLLGGFYLTCLIFVFGVLWPVCAMVPDSVCSKLIRYIREELLIVFATTSSETVLPRMIARLEDLGCEESVVGLVIPTGYSFNLDGTCLYLATATVFLAQATNTPLGIGTATRAAGRAAADLEGRGRRGGRRVRGAGGDAVNRGHDSGGKRRADAGIHRLMSEGIDADQSDRQCGGDDRGGEMGGRAR